MLSPKSMVTQEQFTDKMQRGHEMNHKKPLYIPVNTPDYDAVISGVGTVELGIFTSVTAVVIVVGIILSQLVSILFAVVLGLTIIGITILTVKRDAHNENFFMIMKIIRSYKKRQKKYMYVYSNIYEIPLKGEDKGEEIQ